MPNPKSDRDFRNLQMRAALSAHLVDKGFSRKHADFIATAVDDDSVASAASYRLGAEDTFNVHELAEAAERTVQAQIVREHLGRAEAVAATNAELDRVLQLPPAMRMTAARRMEAAGKKL